MNGLHIEALNAGYGEVRVVRGVDLTCAEGEITVLLGRNGAGKTTTLNAISGLIPSTGSVRLFDELLIGSPVARVRRGLGFVQEGKRVFRERTVEENLRIGGVTLKRRREVDDRIEQAYSRFPILETKRRQAAGMLSGGQQQMLAIAQALMARPNVLMLDEPSAGLAPSVVEEVFGEIGELKSEGLCVLLVEQLIDNSLAVADHVAVLDHGKIVLSERVSELSNWDALRESYLGVAV